MKPSQRFRAAATISLLVFLLGSVFLVNSNSKYGNLLNFEQIIPALAILFFGVSLALYIGATITDKYYKKHDPKIKRAYEIERLLDDLDDRSKYFFENPASTLYYANHLEIDNIYRTYFEEDIVTSITSEIYEESGGEISAFFSKVVGVKQAGKDTTKTTKKYKPKEETTLGKFIRFQQETILRQQIDIGLDLVDIDYQEINELDDALTWLWEVYELAFHESYDEIAEKRNSLFEKASEATMIRLEMAKDLILLDEKFLISEDEKNYICSYTHPIDENFVDKNIRIVFMIPKNENHNIKFDFHKVMEKVIPLRVFGKVLIPLDRQTDNWEMVITPIAVY